MFSKIVDVGIPLSDIRDNSVVAISGFNMANTPEYLIIKIYHQYTKNGPPKNLFVISDALPAIPGRALDKIAENLYQDPEQEFLRGALLPFLGFSPWLQKLVTDNRIECYGWPIGITAYWFREVASGRPGLLTKIGVDTFLDPRNEGAVMNQQVSFDDGGNKTIHIQVISYYDELEDFNFDPSTKEMQFTMPFDWNISRLEENKVTVHQEILIPKPSELVARSYTGTINSIDVT